MRDCFSLPCVTVFTPMRACAGRGEDEEDDAEGEGGEGGEGTQIDDYLCAKMHLVDLAGSERAKRTKAEGARLKVGHARWRRGGEAESRPMLFMLCYLGCWAGWRVELCPRVRSG